MGAIIEVNLNNKYPPKIRENQITFTENFRDILFNDPTLTLQMGHFIKTKCADDIRFDIEMDIGEDFKYYLKIWSKYKCAKVEKIFFLNRRGFHSKGLRSGNGFDWMHTVQKQIIEVVSRLKIKNEISFEGKKSLFSITNPFDLIQGHICRGVFFEQNELLFLRDNLGKNKVIVDVGANIGNHLVFFSQYMSPKKIFPFEPNKICCDILIDNISNNNLENLVDYRGIGLGIGEKAENYRLEISNPNNLGAAKLTKGGDIAVVALDEILKDCKFDFIKIDVEGMELDVLAGAKNLIQKNKPLIFIEVTNINIQYFKKWVQDNNYILIKEYQRVNTIDFFMGPCN